MLRNCFKLVELHHHFKQRGPSTQPARAESTFCCPGSSAYLQTCCSTCNASLMASSRYSDILAGTREVLKVSGDNPSAPSASH